MWWWLVAQAVAQMHLEAPQTILDDNTFKYYTQNLIVGKSAPTQFELSFKFGAASTVTWGSKINETHVQNTVSTPRVHWDGAFELQETATLAFAQLAAEGVAWCDGVVYEGTAKAWPASCTSKKATHARCTYEGGCRFPGSVDNDNNRRVLVRADPHASAVECDLQVTLTNGVRTCASKELVFNPVEAGAAIVQEGQFQSLYFNRMEDNGPAGAVFAIIIILCLVVWVRNMETFLAGTNPKKTTKIAWGVSDLAVTAASASMFATAEGGTAYVPPEIETVDNTGSPKVWFAIYVATQLGGAAIATAAALKRPTVQGGPLPAVVRIALEVQLMTALHWHLPPTMGLALRRTMGFFVGVAALIVVGRDFSATITRLGGTAALMFSAWTATAVTHVVMALLLPTIAQSAGVADKAAVEFAVATAAATVAFAAARLN